MEPRPKPNGGVIYDPVYGRRPVLIPSWRVRLVIHSAEERERRRMRLLALVNRLVDVWTVTEINRESF